jgi:hypothetical protein
MTVLSFVEKVAMGQGDSIMLYRGVTMSGKNFFAFLRCDRKGMDKLKQDSMHSEARDLNEYGEVIYMDFLSDPDKKAEEFLALYLRVEEEIAQLEDAIS